MFKIIDLSVCHENDSTEPYPPRIEFSNHYEGAERLAKLAGIKASDFPDGMALATDRISGSSHSGTHIDAPLHYGPLCEGKKAKSVDEVPLEWCIGNGVVLDMRHKQPGSEITKSDLEEALLRIRYELKPMDIVLLHTGCDKYWGTTTEEYLKMQSGLGTEGLEWLLEKGIKCIGIDAWTLDRPIFSMVQSFTQTGDSKELWSSHIYGRDREYLQIEKLINLDCIPKPTGFLVSALPIKFKGATGGWCRAVALITEE